MKKLMRIYVILLSMVVFAFGQEFAPVGTAVAQFLEINLGDCHFQKTDVLRCPCKQRCFFEKMPL